MLKVVALAGGVGGARMAHGLTMALPAGSLTVVVNVGDDFEHFGLKICPDLDTVCYTLAGLGSLTTGWGRANETWEAIDVIAQLGGPTWFRLGDRDLGVHLERTRRLQNGQRLSQVTADFCQAWEISSQVLPVTDVETPTIVQTRDTEMKFQDYFVRQACQPAVKGFRFSGVERALPAPGVIESLTSSDLLVLCPSNPWVSLDPILAVPGVKEAVAGRRAQNKPTVAVSPIIGGQTVKGPAAKMFTELGITPSPLAVAHHYQHLLTDFFLDETDRGQATQVEKLGVRAWTTDIVMKDIPDRLRLANEILQCVRFLW